MRLTAVLTLATAVSLGAQTVCLADDSGGAATPTPSPTVTLASETPKTASNFDFDYGAPTSPALTLAGLSPDKSTTSSSLKPFVLSLPYFAGGPASGQAIAFDLAPAQFYWANLPYTDYVGSDLLTREAARSRIEAMAYRGISNSDPTKAAPSKIAIGYSVSLLDDSDVFFARPPGSKAFSWDQCTTKAMTQYRPLSEAIGSLSDAKIAWISADLGYFLDLTHRLAAAKSDAERANIITSDELGKTTGVQLASLLSEIAVLKAADAGKPAPDAAPADKAVNDTLNDLASAQEASANLDDATRQKVQAALAEARSAVQTRQAAATPDAESPAQVEAQLSMANQKLLETAQTAAQAKESSDSKALSSQVGYTAAIQTCADQANGWARFSQDLNVGFGSLWNGANGEFSKFSAPGEAVWIGYRYPLLILSNPGQPNLDDPSKATAWLVGGSARFAWNEAISTGVKATPNFMANTTDVWAGLQMLSPNTTLALQVGWFKADAREASLSKFTQSGDRWLVSAGQRIGGSSSGTWLGVSYGNASGTTTVRDDRTFLVTFAFSPPKSPEVFTPPPPAK